MSIKNDITYEYRVFTNRLVDVDSMEVGTCTSKSIKKLENKDKVNGRFFHTSDTDKWYFCWNGKLQELNLKGDSDVTAALEEVKTLINKADAAVKNAEATAKIAKSAAADAKSAAADATAAAENINNKADKEVVEEIKTAVETKAEKAVVEELVQTVGEKANQTIVDELSAKVNAIPSLDGYATKEDIANFITKEDIPSLENLATTTYVDEKVAAIEIPSVDNLATKEEIEGVKTWVNEQGFLTEHQDLSAYAKKEELPSVEGLATETFVKDEIAKAQLEGEGVDLSGYATKEEVAAVIVGYATETWVNNQGYLTEESLEGYAKTTDIPSVEEFVKESDLSGYAKTSDLDAYVKSSELPENYYTKDQIDEMLSVINASIGEAITLTNTILNA